MEREGMAGRARPHPARLTWAAPGRGAGPNRTTVSDVPSPPKSRDIRDPPSVHVISLLCPRTRSGRPICFSTDLKEERYVFVQHDSPCPARQFRGDKNDCGGHATLVQVVRPRGSVPYKMFHAYMRRAHPCVDLCRACRMSRTGTRAVVCPAPTSGTSCARAPKASPV